MLVEDRHGRPRTVHVVRECELGGAEFGVVALDVYVVDTGSEAGNRQRALEALEVTERARLLGGFDQLG